MAVGLEAYATCGVSVFHCHEGQRKGKYLAIVDLSIGKYGWEW